MSVRLGVNNVAKNLGSCKIGVNNVAKNVKKIYAGVNDKAKLVWPTGPVATTDAFKFFFVYIDNQDYYVTQKYLPSAIYAAIYASNVSYPTQLYAWMPSYSWMSNPLGYSIGSLVSGKFTNSQYRLFRSDLHNNFNTMGETERNRLVSPSEGDVLMSTGSGGRPRVVFDLYNIRYKIPQTIEYTPYSDSSKPTEQCECDYLTISYNSPSGYTSAPATFKDETIMLTY
jgi:hypothetical protein